MGICSSRRKEKSIISTTDNTMRVTSRLICASEQCKLYLVAKEELSILKEIYLDLSRKSDSGKTIDKDAFLQFFPLPGLLGERLFKLFDTLKKGSIDFEDFIVGIGRYSKGTMQDKLKLIFELYDLRGDGFIDKAELVSMVHGSLKETVSITDISTTEDGVFESPTSGDLVIKIRTPFMRAKSNSVSKKKKEFTYNRDGPTYISRVHSMVRHILNQFGGKETLDFDEFTQFIYQHPKIFDLFSVIFKEEIWSVKVRGEDDFIPEICIQKSKSLDERNSYVGFQLSKSHPLQPVDMSGIVYKKPEDKDVFEKKYAVLKKSLLMFIENEEDIMPSGVVFLEGCYVNSVNDYILTNKFAVSLSHQNLGYKEVKLWCDTRAERDDWIKKLEKASNCRKFKEYYELKNRIGKGKFSDVYLATEYKTNQTFAVKVIMKKKLNKQERDFMRSELAIMRLIDHPNVIKFKEVFDTKKHLLIVMENAKGGELYERISMKNKFSEYAASRIIKQLLEVVAYLHDIGIIHRDLKPENILLVDKSDIPQIKVADFGLSKLTSPGESQYLACGTLGYSAPEVLKKEGYNHKADIWSIGVITYLLLRGKLPFEHKDKEIQINLTITKPITFEDTFWERITHSGKDFISRLLSRDISQRYSAQEALQHPWIKNAEFFIPRAIDMKKLKSSYLHRGITSLKLGDTMYRECENEFAANSFTQSLPDVLEGFEPLVRHPAETNLVNI